MADLTIPVYKEESFKFGDDITTIEQYKEAVGEWIRHLQIKTGISPEYANNLLLWAIQEADNFAKIPYSWDDTDAKGLDSLPFWQELTSPYDSARELVIKSMKSYWDNYVAKEEEDYKTKAIIEQSKGDAANAEVYAKDLIKNVSNYSDDQLDKLLPTVIGTPREAILAELRNRGRMPISESARKINFRNVTKEQYDLAVETLNAAPYSRDADSSWIIANWNEKTQYDWAKKLLESEPNNPNALRVIQDVAGRISPDLVASGDLTAAQQRSLENYISPEQRAKMIAEFKVPEQPELQKPYYAFLENLEPGTPKTYYKENIGDVYKDFQETLVGGKGGEELRAEWWQTISWANAGLLNPNEPVFENAAITGWANKQGLTVEKYLETPPENFQFGVGVTDEDKKNWQIAQGLKRGFDIQGRQANQDYLTGLKKKKDPWIDFLDKYDWGQSPSQRGFYPSTLAPMASWKR